MERPGHDPNRLEPSDDKEARAELMTRAMLRDLIRDRLNGQKLRQIDTEFDDGSKERIFLRDAKNGMYVVVKNEIPSGEATQDDDPRGTFKQYVLMAENPSLNIIKTTGNIVRRGDEDIRELEAPTIVSEGLVIDDQAVKLAKRKQNQVDDQEVQRLITEVSSIESDSSE